MQSVLDLNMDAFSSGQIGSKIWLCEELEKLDLPPSPEIWLLGGWYGMLAFLLFIRESIQAKKIISFDIDKEANRIANILNQKYCDEGKFLTEVADVNNLSYGNSPDIIINTSTEHFHDHSWFDRIPCGTLMVLQSNDMKHDDHHSNCNSLDQMKEYFSLSEVLYSGDKKFEYSTWGFSRFMLIGRK